MQNTPNALFIAHMSAARNKIFARLKSASTAFDMVCKYDKNSVYTLKKMASTNDDYMLIKIYFEATMSDAPQSQIFKIYRVMKRGSGETKEQKSDNLMLFHGASSKNAIGILEKGFKPSIEGKHGPGVYLTEFSSCAESFAKQKIINNILRNGNINNNLEFIFVNEILESKTLEEIVVEKSVTHRTASPRKNQFEKYIRSGTAKMNSDATDERDSNGMKIRISAPSEVELHNYYVCHEKLVVPRYLIHCFPISQ